MLNRLRRFLAGLPRPYKRAISIIFDVVALMAVLFLSYRLRLGRPYWPTDTQWFLMALAPLIAVPVFIRMGLYRAVIRYLPERAILIIAQAMFLATVIWVMVLFLGEMSGIRGVPRSIPVIYLALGTLVIGGSRFGIKYFLGAPRALSGPGPRVLIYGADNSGMQLASALRHSGSRVVTGFVDDDKALQGHDVLGLRVYSPSRIDDLVANEGVSEIILSMPSIPTARRQEIYKTLSVHPIKIRTLPAITDLASGKYAVGELREIDIDDLLGRSSVPADPELLRSLLAGKVVMVTGGGGSIGSEVARLISRWKPSRIVVFEANEYALYEIERHLLAENKGLNVVPVLGSVTDAALVDRVLKRENVEVLFHAAAHKHVPLLEENPLEGVRNNVLGTATVARAALVHGVKHFVLISTDKAVHPSSVMGATKRWAELIMRECAEKAAAAGTGQRFCAVRFGNVLGSNGSVVPLFREQIRNGGPVTLTDEAMTRYFMSVHEAAELIVQAGALAEGGEIFVLEMGEPVRIRDLAENMVRLAGLQLRTDANPQGDIEIRVTGSRKGEKLKEELFYDPASVTGTSQPRIWRAKGATTLTRDVDAALAGIRQALEAADEDELRRQLFAFAKQ